MLFCVYGKKLLGYIYLIVIVALWGVALNDLHKNYPIDASIEGLSALVSMVIAPFLLKHNHLKIASWLLIIILSIVCFSAMILDTFDHLSAVFVVWIIPIAFYLLGRSSGVIVAVMLLSISGVLMYYADLLGIGQSQFLQSPIAVTNFIVFTMVITSVSYIYESTNAYTHNLLITEAKKREMLYREIHHRVKNSLNLVASMLGLQALDAPKVTAELLTISQDRIYAIGLLHTMFYNTNNLDTIAVSSYFEALIKHIRQSLCGFKLEVSIEIPQELALPMNTMVSLGNIVNELITNNQICL